MKQRSLLKVFVYVLCCSFLSMMNIGPVLAIGPGGLPVGEMFSKGEVTFESGNHAWKKVESSYFPMLPGTKIKTGRGEAVLHYPDNSGIVVHGNSAFTFNQHDEFTLSQGSIEFHLAPASELKIRAGNVSVVKTRTLQAGNNLSAPTLQHQATTGTVTVHSNGSVTVKSIEGKLSILNQNDGVLADLSQKDAITIPAKADGNVQVAQTQGPAPATGTQPTGTQGEGFLGLSNWTWGGIGAAALAAGIGIGVVTNSDSGSHNPVCP